MYTGLAYILLNLSLSYVYAIVNVIKFLILIAGYTIDICILWTCYAHLLVLVFLLSYLSIFYYIVSSVNKDNLFLSIQSTYRLIISFSCLTGLARASRAILYRSGESSHPCLFHNLTHKASSFSLLSMMAAVGFLQIPFPS